MIALAMIRHRARSMLGGFVALALGIALMAASAIIVASSAPTVPQRYARADVLAVPTEAGTRYDGRPVRAVWTQPDADAMAEEIARADDVAAVVAERRYQVRVMDGDRIVGDSEEGDPNGAGWSSAALAATEAVASVAPPGPGEVVLPDAYGRSPGDRVTVLTAGSAWPLTVSATTDGVDVLVPDTLADRAAAGVSVIGVVLDAGADPVLVGDRVRAVVGTGAGVFTDKERGAARSEFDESSDWAGQQLLILIGLLSVFVSVFVVGTTFTFQVATRRRELALLRAVGATPGQVRGLLLREAAVVGLAAAVLGGFLGIAGASLLAGWMIDRDLLARDWPARDLGLRSVLCPVLAAMTLGVATSIVGVWSASRKAAAVTPMEALRPTARQDGAIPASRWWIAGAAAGLAAVLAAATLTADQQGAAMGYVMGTSAALVVALVATAPAYLPHLAGLLPAKRSPVSELLRAEARTGARRLSSTMLPALLTAALAVTMLGMNDTLARALSEHSAGDLPGGVAVRRAGGGPGLTDAAVERAARYAGAPVTSTLPTGVYVDGRWLDAVGLHQDAPPASTVQASPETAVELGWREGDTIELTWRDGTTSRVPVTIETLPPYAELWADLAFPHDLARAHDPSAFVSAAYVDGVDPAGLSAVIAGQGATAQAVDVLIEEGLAAELRLLWLFTMVLLLLSVGYSAVSVANTLFLSTSARRRDLALLRVIGAQRGQVLRLVVSESVLAVGLGLVVGTAASLPALFLLAYSMRDDFDPRKGPVDVDVSLPWPEIGIVFAACLAVGLVAAATAAIRSLRQPPTLLVAEGE